ncbi:hypothetical protein F1643_14575 [Azospirillum sp. INR13]|uniref:hypothetical protein n=1 Tax=Azospirillum sp. INR13 TaxID=2596919 RepID=UPI001892291F|nr:hypothetical protein [Azospirillum sp. INR13]MBF5095471.1 hypothetical protein [Azospirillum sp. INR13]
MADIVVLKHVRLTRALLAIEMAAVSLDGELAALCTAGQAGLLGDHAEEATLLRTYVRTLRVLLQAMTPDEVDEAGLGERHALAEAAVGRCAAALRALDLPVSGGPADSGPVSGIA